MTKSAEGRALSAAQLEIMTIVWDRGDVTVGEVWKALATRRSIARNTVLTMMDRLAAKDWLRRRTTGHVYRYSAAMPRQTALKQLVGRLVDSAFGGSAEGLVMALLDGKGVTKEEAVRIRSMIAHFKRFRS